MLSFIIHGATLGQATVEDYTHRTKFDSQDSDQATPLSQKQSLACLERDNHGVARSKPQWFP